MSSLLKINKKLVNKYVNDDPIIFILEIATKSEIS